MDGQGWDKKSPGSSHRPSRSNEAVASSEGVECVAMHVSSSSHGIRDVPSSEGVECVAGIGVESEMLLALASASKRASSPLLDFFDSPLQCEPCRELADPHEYFTGGR